MEEKSTKSDDNKENNKSTDKSSELEDEKNDKDESVKSIVRSDNKDDEYKKSDDKKHRNDDRKSGCYSRDRDDKKYSYGVKKREFVGGYDHDGKYKGTKSGYYYDDYKNRGPSSYQKSTYVGGKYSKGKDHYDEKPSKRFDSKSKKYEYEYKDGKKNQKESDKKYDAKAGDSKSSSDMKPIEKQSKKEDRKEEPVRPEAESLSRSSSKDEDHSGSTSEIEGSRSRDSKKEKKESDPRAERRIKNKVRLYDKAITIIEILISSNFQDRPALEIYRPGMGKFSRQRLERNKSTESKDGD